MLINLPKAVFAIVALSAAAHASAQVQITRSAFTSGGGSVSAGSLSLTAAIGQSVAGTVAAAPFVLDAGFFTPDAPPPPVCRADFNGDGLLFPDDLSEYITCFFQQIQSPGTCGRADFNGDGLVFPDDLSEYITAFFIGC